MMNEKDAILIRKSWKLFVGIDATVAGDLFYARLFQQNPQLKSVFSSSLEKKSELLYIFLNAIISLLHNLKDCETDIQALAREYAEIGVTPVHYEEIRQALLWTVKTGLNKDWNEELEQAWSRTSIIVMQIMKSANFDNLSIK